MAAPVVGQVDKIIRVIASSTVSWEEAAEVAVAEAAKTISDLGGATLVKADSLVRDGQIVSYRVKLEMNFRLDRSRPSADGGAAIHVRRYLVLANQTLPSRGLRQVIDEKVSTGKAEFHILVPEGPRTVIYGDPTAPADPLLVETATNDRLLALQEAEERLDAFRLSFSHLGPGLTGEVGLGDPLAATRRVMDRAVFDEIIVSTLPSGISRWLKMDLPARLERHFHLPVTLLVQDEA